MKVFILLSLLLFSFSTSLFATVSGNETRFNDAQVDRDVNAQQMEKYNHDNFETIKPAALFEKGIITDANATIVNTAISTVDEFYNHIVDCTNIIDNTKWTASLYDVDLENGTMSCMLAPVNDLANPIGIFKIQYPNAKPFFNKDLKKAREDKLSEIAAAKDQFNSIYDSIKSKQDQLIQAREANQDYLTVPEVLTSLVLTDTNIVDITASRDTGTIQFKNGINVSDKSQVVLSSAESLFNTYTGLGDVSMTYFVLLIAFFGIYGLIHKFSPAAAAMLEKKQDQEKHTPYIVGLILGVLLFVPTAVYNGNASISSDNGKDLARYDIMDTKWQDFERNGYSLFSNWANDAASVIINSTMQSIINKSGIGTADQIANAYAGKVKYQRMLEFANRMDTTCNDGYDTESMYMKNGKYRYSNNSQTPFATSENYAYAMALHVGSANSYYSDLPNSNFYNTNVQNAWNDMNLENEKIGDYYYPAVSIAQCGKNYFNKSFYKNKLDAYTKTLNQLEGTDATDASKLHAIEGLVNFQYQMFNDWGYLAVLGLPVTKLQTELIGGLYNNPQDEVLSRLNKNMEDTDEDGIMHKILSASAYLAVPGIKNLYDVVSKNVGNVGSVFEGIPLIGSMLSGAAKITGGVVGLGVSYAAAKILLGIVPIIGIIVIGLLRFILIITKIFGLHFASLFIMPIAFAKNNLHIITKFVMKIFATMLELPLFALAVYIALEMNGLLHSIGDYFGKKVIIAMLDNAEAGNNINHMGDSTSLLLSNFTSKLEFYLFDGVIEVAIAAISILLIYVIMVTFHKMVMNIIELEGVKVIDDAAENIRSEAGNWGSKI